MVKEEANVSSHDSGIDISILKNNEGRLSSQFEGNLENSDLQSVTGKVMIKASHFLEVGLGGILLNQFADGS
jgi:hypothetical protein